MTLLTTREALAEALWVAGALDAPPWVNLASSLQDSYRHAADRLLTSGILRDVSTLADDEAFLLAVASHRFSAAAVEAAPRTAASTASEWLRALAAALGDRSAP